MCWEKLINRPIGCMYHQFFFYDYDHIIWHFLSFFKRVQHLAQVLHKLTNETMNKGIPKCTCPSRANNERKTFASHYFLGYKVAMQQRMVMSLVKLNRTNRLFYTQDPTESHGKTYLRLSGTTRTCFSARSLSQSIIKGLLVGKVEFVGSNDDWLRRDRGPTCSAFPSPRPDGS